MKKFILLIFLSAFLVTVVSASTLHGTFEGDPIIRITKDGQDMRIDDVPAILYKDRTMVPVYLLRQLGLTVEWDQASQTVDVQILGDETVAPQPAKPAVTQAQLERMKKAVAYIEALDSNGNPVHQGSGFIINSAGLLITNHHVGYVEGKPADLRVEVNGKTYRTGGKELFSDELMDLFGVYLDGETFEFLPISEELPVFGDKVYVIGSPTGVKNQVMEGSVQSVYARQTPLINFISTTFSVAGGTSGSPLLNRNGEVLGVINASNDRISSTTATFIQHARDLYTMGFNQ